MNSKSERKENWKAIKYALRKIWPESVNKKNESSLRNYYVNGETVASVMGGFDEEASLTLAIHLLLCSEEELLKDNSFIQRITNGGDKTGYTDFMGLQGASHGVSNCFYFGANSLYMKRESHIYEQYFKKLRPAGNSEKKLWNGLRIKRTLSLISRIQVNPYNQVWRYDQERFEWIKKQYSWQTRFNYKKYSEQLSSSFCAIEWAKKYPERFDPNIQPIVSYFREFYVNGHKPIKNAYHYVNDKHLSNWAESHGAGGKLYVLIDYISEEYLNQYLPLLAPESRYPNTVGNPSNAVRHFPGIEHNRGNRLSYRVVDDLWSGGFLAKKHLVLEDKMLFLEIDIPLSMSNLGRLFLTGAFVRDIGDLKSRIESQTDKADDVCENPKAIGNFFYLIKPMFGAARVGVPVWENEFSGFPNGIRELSVNFDSNIQDIVFGSEPEDDMLSLIRYMDIFRREGEQPPWQ